MSLTAHSVEASASYRIVSLPVQATVLNVVTFISEECILSEVQIYQCWVREAFTSVCNTYAEYFSTVSDLTSHKMNDGILI